MTALALGIDPEPLGVAPFVHVHRAAARRCSPPSSGWRCTRGPAPASSRRSGAYVGGDIVAGMLATGMDRDKRTRLFIDVGTNCEIVLSDGDTHPRPPPRRPARRSRAARSGAACGPPTAPSRWSSSTRRRATTRRRARRDRRRRAARACAAPAWSTRSPSWSGSGCSTPAGRFVPDEDATEIAPGAGRPADQDRRGAGVRAAPAHARRRARRVRRASPSATCASCSSPRPRSPPAGRCCSRSSASSTATSSRCCSPGSFGSYLSPASAVRIGLVPKLPGAAHRRRRQRRRRGREDGPAVGARAGRRARRCWRR